MRACCVSPCGVTLHLRTTLITDSTLILLLLHCTISGLSREPPDEGLGV
jgi:hypothetical protein